MTLAERMVGGERKPRERRNREAEMMAASLQLFAQNGYAATTVQDIADATGVLKGSIYHYISSKEDLLFKIFLDAHVENEALMHDILALDVSPLERLRIYLERTLHTTLHNIDRTTLYFRDWRHLSGERHETLASYRTQYDRFLRKLIKDASEAESIPLDISLKHVSSFIIGATNWVADWFTPDNEQSIETIIKDYTALTIASIMGAAKYR